MSHFEVQGETRRTDCRPERSSRHLQVGITVWNTPCSPPSLRTGTPRLQLQEARPNASGVGLSGSLLEVVPSRDWSVQLSSQQIEDCIPGAGTSSCGSAYWADTASYDEWPGNISPSDPFDQYFVEAFPGDSLGYVRLRSGTGLDVLGRESVAALLNAASPSVDYQYSVFQVMSLFEGAAAPGGDVEMLRTALEFANSSSCPFDSP